MLTMELTATVAGVIPARGAIRLLVPRKGLSDAYDIKCHHNIYLLIYHRRLAVHSVSLAN